MREKAGHGEATRERRGVERSGEGGGRRADRRGEFLRLVLE